jgi:hypothetical protein
MECGAGSARRRWERVGLECTVVVEVVEVADGGGGGGVEGEAAHPLSRFDLNFPTEPMPAREGGSSKES